MPKGLDIPPPARTSKHLKITIRLTVTEKPFLEHHSRFKRIEAGALLRPHTYMFLELRRVSRLRRCLRSIIVFKQALNTVGSHSKVNRLPANLLNYASRNPDVPRLLLSAPPFFPSSFPILQSVSVCGQSRIGVVARFCCFKSPRPFPSAKALLENPA